MSRRKTNDVLDFYTLIDDQDTPYINVNQWAIQHPSRTLVIGATGSRKTNSIINIISTGSFTKIYLFVRDPDEPLYKYLDKKLSGMRTVHGSPVLEIHSKLDELPDVDAFDKTEQNLLIVDDFISEKNLEKKLGDHVIRGRHQNISMILTSQSYYKIPPLFRNNAQYFILKNVSSNERDMRALCKDLGIKSEKLIKLIDEVNTIDPKSFFMIDTRAKPSERFRINFDVLPNQ